MSWYEAAALMIGTAMLLMAWIVLKLGDRVALHAFDSRPRIASGLIGGTASFGELQRLAGDIDYSSEETNYTFALTSLATVLKRRSMISGAAATFRRLRPISRTGRTNHLAAWRPSSDSPSAVRDGGGQASR